MRRQCAYCPSPILYGDSGIHCKQCGAHVQVEYADGNLCARCLREAGSISKAEAMASLREEVAKGLERAAQILVSEFSYDGEDPRGVKRYQDDVDCFLLLAERIRGIHG